MLTIARRKQLGFFFAILFTRIPHSERFWQVFWPLRAWKCSQAIHWYWTDFLRSREERKCQSS